jgi:outer membrane protein OmpA-like peptidoglycan-associated protein
MEAVGKGISEKIHAVLAVMVLVLAGAAAQAAQAGERYIPTIWVDPDGCEHWVMDDGAEGYMSPHVTRDGLPVCREGNVCGVMNSDQLFATDKSYIAPAGQQRLREFFTAAKARGFVITGHTDSRASDQYNMALSLRRANAVAEIARSIGVKVVDVRGYGERMPRATNTTAAGMQQNRRVEIICVQ